MINYLAYDYKSYYSQSFLYICIKMKCFNALKKHSLMDKQFIIKETVEFSERKKEILKLFKLPTPTNSVYIGL